jgi:hypothetical protein
MPPPPTKPGLTEHEWDALISHYLHYQSHLIGPGWEAVDATAYQASQELRDVLMDSVTMGANVIAKIDVFDVRVPCPGHQLGQLPDIAFRGEPWAVSFGLHRHEDGSIGSDLDAEAFSSLMVVAALYGGEIVMFPFAENGAAVAQITWQIRNHTVTRC